MRNRYEKNYLSTIEGGDTIRITFKDGRDRTYNNIKDVSAYVAKVLKESECKIEKIEMEKEVITKEWTPLFGRSKYGVYGSESHNAGLYEERGWMELEYYDEYQKCLATGMFFEWYPNLTGEWSKDKYWFCHQKRYGKK
jgi:hypothetical protein